MKVYRLGILALAVMSLSLGCGKKSDRTTVSARNGEAQPGPAADDKDDKDDKNDKNDKNDKDDKNDGDSGSTKSDPNAARRAAGGKGPKPWPQPITVSADPSATKKAAAGINAFTADLWAQLPADRAGENTFVSPWSVAVALSMAYAGARNKTAAEMRKVLRSDLAPKTHHDALGAQIKGLTDTGEDKAYELIAANSLWPHQSFAVRPEYVKSLERHYGVGVRSLDYTQPASVNAKIINGWVKHWTQGKIPNLLSASALSPTTRLVLVNTLYFKGTWVKPFKKSLTQPAPFHVADGVPIQVPMMRQTDHYRMLSKPAYEALRLPYRGKRIVMEIVLPKKKTGLATVEKALVQNQMRTGLQRAPSQRVRVYLPRFDMRTHILLKETLKRMGLNRTLSLKKADFSGIAPPTGEGFCIDEAIHEAVVEVNEEGTVASAATALVMKAGAAPMQPKVFRVDRPFFFLLRDRVTGAVLFAGRVVKPTTTK